MKKSTFQLPSISPHLLDDRVSKTHKNSKSISFPALSALTPQQNVKNKKIREKSLKEDSNLFEKEQNTIDNIPPIDRRISKDHNKSFKSPMKRIINFIEKNGDETKATQKESSKDFISLVNKRELMLYWSHKRSSKKILEQLMENLWLAYQMKSLKMLTDTIYLIGDFHLCDGNIDGALYSYFQMKVLCDLTQNFKMKLFSLLALANCCKILKNHNKAIFLYKKALEYVWALNEEEIEAKIYDRIGMLYFHFGEIRKARYYHDRSLEYRLESDISPSKYSSSRALEKFHQSLKNLYFENISLILLNKIGVSFQRIGQSHQSSTSKDELFKSRQNIDNNWLEEDVITDTPKVKFGTNLPLEAILENLFYEKDFVYEIPSPRYPRGYTEEDILLGRIDIIGKSKREREKSNDIAFSMNQLNLLNINTQKNRKPVVKIDLDPMKMKIPINEKIKLRNQIVRLSKNKEKIFGNKILSKQKIKPAELLGFGIYYNHLTPNRNLEAFNYHYTNKTQKLNKYYENMLQIEEKDAEDKSAHLKDLDTSLE